MEVIPGCERVRIIEIHPPRFVKTVTEGEDRITGTILNLKTAVNLKNVCEENRQGETEMTYVIEVNIVGTLVNLGDTVIRAKSE